uniref:Core-binding (CB) domain-containing protein n=1 Tax=Xenopus tropicalis TaxID=8364 RepID=A0A803K2V7_XENTR
MHESPRSDGLSHRGSTICAISPPAPSDNNPQALAQNLPTPEDIPLNGSQKITGLVAQPQSPVSRSDIHRTTMADSHNGCQPPGMGGDLSREVNPGPVVSRGSPSSNQPPRNKSNPPSPTILAVPSMAQASAHPDRQRHRRGLHQPPGRHKEQGGKQRSNTHSALGGRQRSTTLRHPHPRDSQLGSGLSQQTPSGSRGMGTAPRRLSDAHSQVGGTPGRPDGHQTQSQGGKILRKVSRPAGRRDRCHDDTLVLPPGLRLPTSSDASSSSQKDSQRKGHSYRGRPMLAKEILVLRSFEPLPGTSSTAPTTGRSSLSGSHSASESSAIRLNGMALEAAILREKGLSEEVILTMLKARKPSTSKAYHRTWDCYRSWCDQQHLEFRECNIPTVLDFLQAGLAKGLRLGSLKAQVSALSILFQERLALHEDIRTFLQGVSRLVPPFRHPIPPWDLNLVLKALLEPPFEPLESVELQFLTWKTVFLVAIASIRRVSELGALSCSPPFLIFQEDRAVLRTIPSFLPKVTSSFHINAEIILPSFCNNPQNEKVETPPFGRGESSKNLHFPHQTIQKNRILIRFAFRPQKGAFCYQNHTSSLDQRDS